MNMAVGLSPVIRVAHVDSVLMASSNRADVIHQHDCESNVFPELFLLSFFSLKGHPHRVRQNLPTPSRCCTGTRFQLLSRLQA